MPNCHAATAVAAQHKQLDFRFYFEFLGVFLENRVCVDSTEDRRKRKSRLRLILQSNLTHTLPYQIRITGWLVFGEEALLGAKYSYIYQILSKHI